MTAYFVLFLWLVSEHPAFWLVLLVPAGLLLVLAVWTVRRPGRPVMVVWSLLALLLLAGSLEVRREIGDQAQNAEEEIQASHAVARADQTWSWFKMGHGLTALGGDQTLPLPASLQSAWVDALNAALADTLPVPEGPTTAVSAGGPITAMSASNAGLLASLCMEVISQNHFARIAAKEPALFPADGAGRAAARDAILAKWGPPTVYMEQVRRNEIPSPPQAVTRCLAILG